MKISTKLLSVSVFVVVVFVALSVVSWNGLNRLDGYLVESHDTRRAIDTVRHIQILMSENRGQAFRAMQHDPRNPFVSLHDHPLTNHSNAMSNNFDVIDGLWKEFQGFHQSSKVMEISKEFYDSYLESKAGFMKSRQSMLDGEYAEGGVYMLKTVNKLFDKSNDKLASMVEKMRAEATEQRKQSESAFSFTLMLIVSASIFGALLVSAVSFVIIRSVSRKLHGMSDTMKRISSSRDLTIRVDDTGNDEVAETAQAFNGLVDSLKTVIHQIGSSATEVASSAHRLAQVSDGLRRAAADQSEAASATAATTEQITVSIGQVSDNASTAHNLSQSSRNAATEAMQVTQRNVTTMESIARTMETNARRVDDLESKSGEITAIVQVIKEIAEQTNLLALNAAIEAARAGDQGRGFAVVADEVRKLAEKTSQSTQSIAGIIGSIQSGVQLTAEEMRSSSKVVQQGMDIAREVQSALETIRQNTERVDEEVSGIANAAREQSTASTGIAQNVERIAQMSDSSTDAVAHASQNAESLSDLANRLRNLVEGFRT